MVSSESAGFVPPRYINHAPFGPVAVFCARFSPPGWHFHLLCSTRFVSYCMTTVMFFPSDTRFLWKGGGGVQYTFLMAHPAFHGERFVLFLSDSYRHSYVRVQMVERHRWCFHFHHTFCTVGQPLGFFNLCVLYVQCTPGIVRRRLHRRGEKLFFKSADITAINSYLVRFSF